LPNFAVSNTLVFGRFFAIFFHVLLGKRKIFMTGAAAMGHGPNGLSNSQTLFPPAELELLQSSDREAARNIVCLLGGLFIVGILLYASVCLWTA